jgi:hypothetical protein
MCRDLIGLYGITLPDTDPEIVSMKRMLAMVENTEFPTPGGYPEVGEQAILDHHSAELDRRLADLGVIAPQEATRIPTSGEDSDFWYDGEGGVGDPYETCPESREDRPGGARPRSGGIDPCGGRGRFLRRRGVAPNLVTTPLDYPE